MTVTSFCQPTNHGFDEFFGNLYHLNAEEEPENEDYPTEERLPGFREEFGPRGVIHSYADGRIEDTGPLTRLRQETIDDETVAAAIDFIRRTEASGTPWFVWWSGTRMHFRTHVKEGLRGISGQDEYSDGMVEHDMHIGQFLDLLDELGIADETLVFYSTACYEQVVKALGAVGSSNRGTDTGSGSVEPAHRASSGLIPEERRVPGGSTSSCLRREELRTTVGMASSPVGAGASGFYAAIDSSLHTWSASNAVRFLTTANA